jgi:hypothetical protein
MSDDNQHPARALFEKWHKETYITAIVRHAAPIYNHWYTDDAINGRWAGWQAAYKEYFNHTEGNS